MYFYVHRPTDKMWDKLSERTLGEVARLWWESDNESYIYYNRGDGRVSVQQRFCCCCSAAGKHYEAIKFPDILHG